MIKLSLLFLSLLCITACGKDESIPKDILPEKEMKSLLWDMVSASQLLNNYIVTKDSVDIVAESARIYGKVFQIHHISREEFDKSYAYYRNHPELMKAILDSLGKKQVYSIGKFEQRTDSTRKKMPLPMREK